ncbi:hypothetical protein O0L34_g3675 [Tuta absoluta]|nr:hypothetical protein O0L34_g3675 [Tuta absoluta]
MGHVGVSPGGAAVSESPTVRRRNHQTEVIPLRPPTRLRSRENGHFRLLPSSWAVRAAAAIVAANTRATEARVNLVNIAQVSPKSSSVAWQWVEYILSVPFQAMLAPARADMAL